jgi:hypothetical protein
MQQKHNQKNGNYNCSSQSNQHFNTTKKTILPTIRPVFLHVAPLFGWLKSGATYAIGPIPTVGFLEEPPI